VTWLPQGFGYNVVTLTWLQTAALEIGIAVGVWTMYRILTPLIVRMGKLVELADSLDDSTADAELKSLRERRR